MKPVDAPSIDDREFDIEAEIALALEKRPELKRQELAFDNDEILVVVRRAIDRHRLEHEHRLLPEQVQREFGVENIIGKGLEAKIDDKGLRLKAQIAEGTRLADETWKLIQQKMVRAFSIGFRILKDEWVDAPGKNDGPKIRKITKLELYEVSVVAIPANAQSLFSVKAGIMHGTDLFVPVREGRASIVEVTKTEDEYPETLEALNEIARDMDSDLAEAEILNWNKEINRG